MEIRSVTETSGAQEKKGEMKKPEKPEKPEKHENPDQLHQEKTYSKEEIVKEVGNLNKLLESNNSHLHFVFHEKLKEYYVQVVSDDTNQVIKEIPPKRIMDLVANFYEKLGLIIDKKI